MRILPHLNKILKRSFRVAKKQCSKLPYAVNLMDTYIVIFLLKEVLRRENLGLKV